MAISALIVKVPEAEHMVADLRQRFDASAQLGVPAHITVLFPFMSPNDITSDVLAQAEDVFASAPAFSFVLNGIGTFDEKTVYLNPSPAAAFVKLTTSITARFPAFPPLRGAHAEVIPHLTVSLGNARDVCAVTATLEERLCASPTIRSECAAVSLLENSSGRWKRHAHVRFASVNDERPSRSPCQTFATSLSNSKSHIRENCARCCRCSGRLLTSRIGQSLLPVQQAVNARHWDVFKEPRDGPSSTASSSTRRNLPLDTAFSS